MLAIIIPFYKIHFFERTIESLCNQTNKNFCVYIGDDASPYCPLAIISKLDGVIDYRYQRFDENIGGKSLVSQWNRCLEMAGDEKWFMVLGDDDYLSENFVDEFHTAVKKIGKKNIGVIKSSQRWVDEQGNILNDRTDYEEISSALVHFEDKYLGKSRMSLSEIIFRKDLFKKYGFTDLPMAWWSDVLAFLDTSQLGEIYFMKYALVYVRISEISISGSETKINEKNIAKVKFLSEILNRHGLYLPKKLYQTLVLDFVHYNKLYNSKLKLEKVFFEKLGPRAAIKFLTS